MRDQSHTALVPLQRPLVLLSLPLVLLSLALCACGASRPVDRASLVEASARSELRFAPASLRVTRAGRVEVALSDDGRVMAGDALIARVEARRFVGPDGRVLATLGDRGALALEGASVAATLSADGAVEGSAGQRMLLDDEGRVVFTDPAHPGQRAVTPWSVEGLSAGSRPVAGALVAVLMLRARSLHERH